jgi:hypothetical protein
MANVKPETELSAVATRVLSTIRDSDTDYLWTALIPPMVRYLGSETIEPDKRLSTLRTRTYELAGYKTAAYPAGTRPDQVDPAVVMLYETAERSPQFESAVTQAARAAILAADSVLDVRKEKDAGNGRSYLVAPWSQVQPFRNMGGQRMPNTDASPFRITVATVNRMYAAHTRPKARASNTGRVAANVTALARVDAPEARAAVQAAIRENVAPVAALFGEALREVKELAPEQAQALETLRAMIDAALARAGLQADKTASVRAPRRKATAA